MTVITKASTRGRTNNRTTEREPDEFEGLWLNPVVLVGDSDNPKPVRYPRGVALSDLKERKIYESMDPDFAAELTLLNQRIERLKARALELDEGEHVIVNIPMVLYRRQEEADVAPTAKADVKAIDDELFG